MTTDLKVVTACDPEIIDWQLQAHNRDTSARRGKKSRGTVSRAAAIFFLNHRHIELSYSGQISNRNRNRNLIVLHSMESDHEILYSATSCSARSDALSHNAWYPLVQHSYTANDDNQ